MCQKMWQELPAKYPKVIHRKDGRIELTVMIGQKRLRLQNGSSFQIDLKPNAFREEERLAQGQLLAALIYQKLKEGYTPKRLKQSIKTITKNDLHYLNLALESKVQGNFSKHHIDALQLGFKQLKESLDKHHNICPKKLIEVLQSYTNNTSFNSIRQNMNILCRKALELGMKSNPIDKIKPKRAIAKLNKPIDDIPELLSEIKAFNEKLYLCCLLTYGCLLRPHREVRELTWGDFDKDLNYIKLSGSRNKSGRNRIVPIPYYIKAHLKPSETSFNVFSDSVDAPNPDYFKTLWKRFKKRSKVLLKEQTLYSFRHTGAIDIYKRTGSIEKLRTAMGHSSIMVSLTYLRGLEIIELEESDMPRLEK